jgi:putative endonuclease
MILPMAAAHLERGAAAETLATQYLQEQGLEIVARNLRCRAGELDIVCLDRGVLVIVEVRHRSGLEFGGALASVTRRKLHKLLRAASFYYQRRPDWRARVLRFDVLALQLGPDGRSALTWVKDAFRAT